MPRRRNVVRLGIPALVVGGLAIAALWRIGAPAADGTGAATGVPTTPVPITEIADLLLENAAGRRASLEHVAVREVTSARTFWIGDEDMPAFVVLDPDVKRAAGVRIEPGLRVTLIGLVRPAPAAAPAMRQWNIDEATARRLAARGTYLHATEIRPD
jgi:hypothetical protein